MNTTKLIVAHFSPTGGTKRVADAIAAGFDMPVVQIDLTVEGFSAAVGEKDMLMAVLPVYIGRVPAVALKRLSALRGNGQKAVAVVVYGNREYEAALLETKNALEGNGFRVIAAAAFVAEHSIVRSVAAGRPDAQDEKIAQQFACEIMAKSENAVSIQVPGVEPDAEPKTSPLHPSGDEKCIRCGVCAERCPVRAIPVEAPDQTKGDVCINCLRCVQVCPVQCRALPASFLAGIEQMLREKAAGYKLPEIFV